MPKSKPKADRMKDFDLGLHIIDTQEEAERWWIAAGVVLVFTIALLGGIIYAQNLITAAHNDGIVEGITSGRDIQVVQDCELLGHTGWHLDRTRSKSYYTHNNRIAMQFPTICTDEKELDTSFAPNDIIINFDGKGGSK